METFEELLDRSVKIHGHLCAGQVLGVRMSMLGMKYLSELGIQDPRGKDRKRIVVYVEIDRCATDAIESVTGCRLGKRTLKFRDWGKMAATFVDLETGKGVRIAALDSSRQAAERILPGWEDKNKQQIEAYKVLPDEDMFQAKWVMVDVGADEMHGAKSEKFFCPKCGEDVAFNRIIAVDGVRYCMSCGDPRLQYWRDLE